MAEWVRRLEWIEGLAYAVLMEHCDRCGPCGAARLFGDLLDGQHLCPQGRRLARIWDASEATIADALLATA